MNIIPIDNISHPGLEVYARLTEAQLRNRLEPERGIFIAESAKVIRIALQQGYIPLSFLSEEKHLEQVCQLIQTLNNSHSETPDSQIEIEELPVYTAPRETLAALTGYELSRGVLAAMRRPRLPDTASICRGRHRIAILDNVVNSTNTGAIFRAATALGIEALLLTPTCSDPLNRRSVRVSMGTVLQMPWTYIAPGEWPGKTIEQLHAWGFQTIALALSDKALPIDDPVLLANEQLAIVLGTEGNGLSDSVIDTCDYTAIIPMQQGVDSLNVAAAASVAFWQLRKRKEACQ